MGRNAGFAARWIRDEEGRRQMRLDETEKHCRSCGAVFHPQRHWAQFCSGRCRMRKWVQIHGVALMLLSSCWPDALATTEPTCAEIGRAGVRTTYRFSDDSGEMICDGLVEIGRGWIARLSGYKANPVAVTGKLRLKVDGKPMACDVTNCVPVAEPTGSPKPTVVPPPIVTPGNAVSLNAPLSAVPGARGLDGQGIEVGEERWYYLDVSGSYATLRTAERANVQCSNFALCVRETGPDMRCDGSPSIGAEHGIFIFGPGRAYVRVTGLQTCATQDGLSSYMVWWQ